jgi:hypothetical protein
LHPDDRVSVDIRAAAAALREQYGVSSVSLFGSCYGGGRALEATARVYPKDTMDDVNGEEGPTHGKSNAWHHVILYYTIHCSTWSKLDSTQLTMYNI